jgi:hypothetical protein
VASELFSTRTCGRANAKTPPANCTRV